ncbi:sulfur carrier protein ThiS [Leisingera daeponensis]|uniref:sulfur carrier protein ThiS n=1 Tax=Leisingera daeponensis TaxID=405746 RepID=UPI000183A791|nr:sulfur carrier protein ThiS [Leisingera daeponensis]EDZ47080.1 thiamine biosynthesis protein ThiS [Rhodobacterales bacterium Y4I]
MKIIVNAEPREVSATDLQAVLHELGFACSAVATALNGTFVAREKREEVQLCDGDRLEVLAPMQGG